MDDLTEYKQCLDLMQFHEVYCRKDGGVVNGNANGVIVIFGMLALWFIVAALIQERKKKPH